jgi:ribosomal protein L7/L12
MPSDAEDIANLKVEVARLTTLVDTLYKHLGIGQLGATSLNQPDPAIVDAIQRGNKIMAIKIWRERTGVGLAQAKDAVDELARSMGY